MTLIRLVTLWLTVMLSHHLFPHNGLYHCVEDLVVISEHLSTPQMDLIWVSYESPKLACFASLGDSLSRSHSEKALLKWPYLIDSLEIFDMRDISGKL